jgi:hypothetical protein
MEHPNPLTLVLKKRGLDISIVTSEMKDNVRHFGEWLTSNVPGVYRPVG